MAKSNILVNLPEQAKYFYQDLDATGERLNGSKRYTVTFAKDGTPRVQGFWSLTLYNEHHFFAPNILKHYSVGTKNKDLELNGDGSLTIYVQADEPAAEHRSNWLPALKGDLSLFLRAYWPKPQRSTGHGRRLRWNVRNRTIPSTAFDGTWKPGDFEEVK